MTPTAITQVLTTLEQAETVLHLSQSVDPDFFLEWQRDLPALTEAETARLDRIRARYRYHRNSGHLAEGVVNLVVVSPLLELAGFYDPPFQLRAECSVSLELESVSAELEGRRLQGRLDFLVVQQGLWLGIVESKGTDLNVEDGIPQALASMYASPRSQGQNRPIYGMVTNGGQFLFVKLLRPGKARTVAQYDLSPLFSHLPVQNQLYDVAKVLKHLATVL
ncbi:MAG: type I restriction endonuclease subunit R [Prochlorothrix sp.]|nr:type I restriction endonuclease subunit R [Prochlorothrix sp.]